jgi:hypothetical protein
METKSILKSKTFWTNIIGALIGCLAIFTPETLSGLGIGDNAQVKVLTALGIVMTILNIILRAITTTQITWIILLFLSLQLTSCMTPNKAMTKIIDYAKTHGEASKTTFSNGVTLYKAKYKDFYNPAKLKENYSKLTVNYDALVPSIEIQAATKDTTNITPQILPSFKK